MPTTPKHALPYPASTDPVNQGATNFQNLATALDTANLVPAGGSAGQVLQKSSATDFACGWVSLPTGGMVPAGGSTGQVLQKTSGTDYATGWVTHGTVPAGGVANQVLTKTSGTDYATAWATPSGGGGGGLQGQELDYAQITADTAAISVTTEGAAVAVVTGNAITYDGTRIKVEFWSNAQTSGELRCTLVVYRDASAAGQSVQNLKAVASNAATNAPYVAFFDTPTAGVHTYAIRAFVNTGSVVFKAGAAGPGALLPAWLRVTRA